MHILFEYTGRETKVGLSQRGAALLGKVWNVDNDGLIEVVRYLKDLADGFSRFQEGAEYPQQFGRKACDEIGYHVTDLDTVCTPEALRYRQHNAENLRAILVWVPGFDGWVLDFACTQQECYNWRVVQGWLRSLVNQGVIERYRLDKTRKDNHVYD